MDDRSELSVVARERMQAMLPDLLGAVRWRRRRRRLTQAGVVVGVLAVAVAIWPEPGEAPRRAPGGGPEFAARAVCEVVRDNPEVVARYLVATSVSSEWFVDDEELQGFLRGDQRPDGIVRVGGKVLVASAAVDPFPATANPELDSE